MSETVCECTFFEEGDLVESRLNPSVVGIVVGNSNFGQYVTLQLVGSLAYQQFSAVTLRHHASEIGDGSKEDLPTEDNVIRVDFTKGARLEPDTKTEGAA